LGYSATFSQKLLSEAKTPEMKPFLPIAVLFSLAVFACHKKTDTLRTSATSVYWKLTGCEYDGPVKLVYHPSNDSLTELHLDANNMQYSLYPQKGTFVSGHYTLSPDSVLNFDASPVLTADSSWRLPQQAKLRVFQGDSMVISSYPIPPSGLSTFTFIKVALIVPM